MNDLIKAVAAADNALRAYRTKQVLQRGHAMKLHPSQAGFLKRLEKEVEKVVQNHYAIDLLLSELEVLLYLEIPTKGAAV